MRPGALDRFDAVTRTIREPEQLRTYECDGLTGRRVVPALVALPDSTAEVQAVVRICNEESIPFVARGAGTGLSGGALPVAEGIVVSLARLDRILEVDLERGEIVVEPGVANLDVTRAVAADGFYYAPDPSSQQVCTIGGNVAENSGGAHCLKYGFTVNHVLEAEVVLPDGELVRLSVWDGGPDLLGAFIGSEGTLGIATRLRFAFCGHPKRRGRCSPGSRTRTMQEPLSPRSSWRDPPRSGRDDGRRDDRGRGGRGRRGLPAGCGAVLIVDLDGPLAQVEEDLAKRRGAVPRDGARRAPDRVRPARPCRGLARTQGCVRGDGPDQPRLLRAGRRRAADEAAARAAADRRALAGARASRRQRLPRRRRQPASARALRRPRRGRGRARGGALAARSWSSASTQAVRSRASTASAPTRHARCRSCSARTTSRRCSALRSAFDPHGLANPGKLFPTPRLCGEVPGPYRAHPLEKAGLADRLLSPDRRARARRPHVHRRGRHPPIRAPSRRSPGTASASRSTLRATRRSPSACWRTFRGL